MTDQDATQPLPPHDDPFTEHDQMTDTTALTTVPGTPGFEQRIAIDPTKPIILTVTNASGEAMVQTTERPDVLVYVRRTDRRDTPDDDPQISISTQGNEISVRPSWGAASGVGEFARKLQEQVKRGLNDGDWNFSGLKFSPDLSYDIRIEVPRDLIAGSRFALRTASGKVTAIGIRDNVSLASASGKIEAENLDGTISMHSASGSIHATQITGSVEANSASGSITLDNGEGWLAARSASGKIAIDHFTLKNAKVTTVSGALRISAIMNNVADYTFETVSGSLQINSVLPADSAATLTHKSMSGSATAHGAWNADGRRAWTSSSTITAAGPSLRTRSVSGSLTANAHIEESIPTRHEALPSPIGPDEDPTDAFDLGKDIDDATAPLNDIDFPFGRRDQERGSSATNASVEWKDWIRTTVRAAEETARHVVNAFQQPVEPLDVDVTPERPAAPKAPAAPEAPKTPPTPPTPPTVFTPGTPTAEQVATDEQAAIADEQAAIAEEHARIANETIPATASDDDTDDPDEIERRRILEAVERGEIDIEDALTQIEQDHPRRV